MAIDFHILIKYQGGNIIANPQGRAGHKPAKKLDIALSMTQQLDGLLDRSGFDEMELISVKQQIGVIENEILNIQEMIAERTIKDDEAFYQTALNASMAKAIMEHAGTISDPAILKASEAELPTWREHYQADLRTIAKKQTDHIQKYKGTDITSDIDYARMLAEFDKLACYQWQVLRRLGEI